jgi:hypothetical protein
MADIVKINRAPVLTLWAAVVAENLGYSKDEALSLGKAVAGLNAQAKGRSLGIFHPAPKLTAGEKKRGLGEEFWVEICGRPVPAINTQDGVRAVVKSKAIAPDSVEAYLEKKFGDSLNSVREAMRHLAESLTPADLMAKAFGLYEAFRPDIEPGARGWGQAGDLDLSLIRSLAQRKK